MTKKCLSNVNICINTIYSFRESKYYLNKYKLLFLIIN